MADETRVHTPHDPIPGERDPSNLTRRQPGATSGQFAGADIPVSDHQDWLDEVTAREHQREGGGGEVQSHKKR